MHATWHCPGEEPPHGNEHLGHGNVHGNEHLGQRVSLYLWIWRSCWKQTLLSLCLLSAWNVAQLVDNHLSFRCLKIATSLFEVFPQSRIWKNAPAVNYSESRVLHNLGATLSKWTLNVASNFSHKHHHSNHHGNITLYNVSGYLLRRNFQK